MLVASLTMLLLTAATLLLIPVTTLALQIAFSMIPYPRGMQILAGATVDSDHHSGT